MFISIVIFLYIFLLFWIEFDRNFPKYISGTIVVCEVKKRSNNGITNEKPFFIIVWFSPKS